jgi:hypothetical protein
MAPKHKSSETGNLEMPFVLREKVKAYGRNVNIGKNRLYRVHYYPWF